MALVVKNLSAMQETWVQSLGQEDSLDKRMATNSCILAWKIPRTEEPLRLQSMGSLKSQTHQTVGKKYHVLGLEESFLSTLRQEIARLGNFSYTLVYISWCKKKVSCRLDTYN